MLLQELELSEKQWVEVCGQISKLDKFFPLTSLPMNKAREAQAAAVARGHLPSCFVCTTIMYGVYISHVVNTIYCDINIA